MIILSIFILQALSPSLSVDIQLEGSLKFGQDLINKIQELTNINYRASDFRLPFGYFRSKGKLPMQTQLGVAHAVKRALEVQDEPNNVNYIKEPNKLKQLEEYVDHLIKKGTKILKNISNQIKEDTKSQNDVRLVLATVTSDYENMMRNYHKYVMEQNVEAEVDKEFLFIDMLETSNRLILSEAKKLLNHIVTGLDPKLLKKNLQGVTEKIYKQSIINKNEEVLYVCSAYNICKQYPSFSDYCAEFISEILKLPEDKFTSFFDTLIKIAKFNSEFFATVTEKEDRELMEVKLKSISNSLSNKRSFFVVLRSVITQRYKTIYSGDEKLRTKSKAMRILLDIIDKASGLADGILSTSFETTVIALKEWVAGSRKDIEDVVGEFVAFIIRKMEHNLTKIGKQEISVLVEILLKGDTDKVEIYQRLFKFGSKYIKGEGFNPDVDVI